MKEKRSTMENEKKVTCFLGDISDLDVKVKAIDLISLADALQTAATISLTYGSQARRY